MTVKGRTGTSRRLGLIDDEEKGEWDATVQTRACAIVGFGIATGYLVK